MATIFATGATTESMTGRVLEVTHATITRIKCGPTDGVEIRNRSGVTLFLDIDAAKNLGFLLPKVCEE